MLVMLALGFAAGLPNLLIFDTLSAWLRQVDVPLRTIGLFSLATLAYSLKFPWAPLVDRIAVLADAAFGPSPGLMLMAQAVVILGLWLVSGPRPAANLLAGGLLRRAGRVRLGDARRSDRCLAHRGRGEEERRGAMAAMYRGATASPFLRRALRR